MSDIGDGADAHLTAETLGRVEVKVTALDDRIRKLEIELAGVRAALNRPPPSWPPIVSAIVPSLIAGIALVVALAGRAPV